MKSQRRNLVVAGLPSRGELQAVRSEALSLITDLRDVRQELQGVLGMALEKQNERYAGRMRQTETALTRGVESHDQAAVVSAVVSLLNSHEEMARDWHAETLQACPGNIFFNMSPARTTDAIPP